MELKNAFKTQKIEKRTYWKMMREKCALLMEYQKFLETFKDDIAICISKDDVILNYRGINLAFDFSQSICRAEGILNMGGNPEQEEFDFLFTCINPGDTVLDPFSGAGTTNKVAVECGRNAIGIELQKEWYDLAIEKRFSLWDDSVYESDDSVEKMKERFNEQLIVGKEQSAKGKAEKEEKKAMSDKKKNLQAQIKELEAELVALGIKKAEIKKIKDESKGDIVD